MTSYLADYLNTLTGGGGLSGEPAEVLDATAAFVKSKFWQALDKSAVGWVHTGDTSEVTVLTLTGIVPAGLLGPNGILRVTSLWSCAVNDSSVKTGRIKVNGTNVETATLTSARAFQKMLLLRNRNAANSQVATATTQSGSFASSTSPIATYSFDTTAALDLTFTIQNAAIGDSTKLEAYHIEALHGD